MAIKEALSPIPGFSGYYVSKEGKVFSDKRLGKKIQLKDSRTIGGYRKIALMSDDKQIKYFQVHRLVAQCFLKNPKNLPIVNHKNGEKDDNRLSNLEWTDAKGNAKHYQEVLKHNKSRKQLEKEDKEYFNKYYEKLCEATYHLINIYGKEDPEKVVAAFKILSGRSY